jgi:hypothetical protein
MMMADDQQKIDEALRDLDQTVRTEMPELAALADKLAQGIADEDTVAELVRMSKEQDTAEHMEKIFARALAPLQDGQSTQSTSREIVKKASGGQMLNPLFQAALVERLQFDGDIPELRTGPLPEGASPAIPVQTNARNPLVLGAMLAGASEEVLRLIEDKTEDLRAEGREPGKELLVPEDDPEEYRRGRLPVPLSVSEPSAGTLATLPMAERQKYARAVLVTTQGRRSAAGPIGSEVCKRLAHVGIDIDLIDEPRDIDTVAHASWTLRVTGEGENQPNFSPMDVAIGSLTYKLKRQLEGAEGGFVLHVDQASMIAERIVGWVAKVWGA